MHGKGSHDKTEWERVSFAFNAKTPSRADRAGELEVFVATVEAGSFSAAGRSIGLSPSAVSRTVGRIETRLGVRLLLRSTRVLTLTVEGQAYLAAVRRILKELDSAEQSIADLGAPKGRLRISAASPHGRLCILPLLGEFTALYPNILVELSLTDALVDIAAGEADVAIRFGPLPDSSLMARKLGESPRVVVASPAYLERAGTTPQAPGDLVRHNCLNFSFRRAEPVWPFQRGPERFTLAVTGNIEADTGEALGQLAVMGVGVARVALFSVADDLRAGRLLTLLDAYNPGDVEVIHAVFVGGPHTPARVRVFVDFLAQRLPHAGC
jgi:DNA-binding transcriptional LysR family regulator